MKIDSFHVCEVTIIIECLCHQEHIVSINASHDFDEPFMCHKCKRFYKATYKIEVEEIE